MRIINLNLLLISFFILKPQIVAQDRYNYADVWNGWDNYTRYVYLWGFLDRKKIAIVKMSFTTCYLQVVYKKTGGGSVEIGELKDTPYRWVFDSESEATKYLSRWEKRIHWYLQAMWN